MRLEDIRAHIRKHPFQPIRVFVSDGSFYDVMHHDFMIVGRTEIVIGLASGPEEFPKQKAYIDPLHITRIEPINGKDSLSNGRKTPSN
jgi:hypothetical protein